MYFSQNILVKILRTIYAKDCKRCTWLIFAYVHDLASPNTPGLDLMTPYFTACVAGSLGHVELLLQHKDARQPEVKGAPGDQVRK